jgi:aminoglycoside phosphotransferase (APT) family kinase protein
VRPGSRLASVEPLAGGVNSTVFELRLADGTSLVLKLYSELLAWELGKEPFVYGLLAGRGLPVPEILHTDDSRTLLPRGFALMTKLDGRMLADVQPSLGEEERMQVYRRIGALLRQWHEVRLDGFGYLGHGEVVDPLPSNADYMRSLFEQRLATSVELGLPGQLARRIAAHAAGREELFTGCEEPCLCHNDCNESNVLVECGDDGWRVSGVLDVGNAVAADPLLDLAKTSAYSRWASDAKVDALAEGHGDLRDGWREAVDLYELFHRLELWWWFASTHTQTEHLRALETALARAVGV